MKIVRAEPIIRTKIKDVKHALLKRLFGTGDIASDVLLILFTTSNQLSATAALMDLDSEVMAQSVSLHWVSFRPDLFILLCTVLFNCVFKE